LIVEALTFKLALDFFSYLFKSKVNLEDTRISFYDRIRREYVNFSSIAQMQSYFDENYLILDNCILGDLVSIETFRVNSNLYDFETNYIATDVVGSYKLTAGSSYDIQRNAQRSNLTSRQISMINNAVDDYLRFYNEIKRIYISGIYSPCYAVPGWSQGTWYLKSLREGLLVDDSEAKFPYTKVKIEKEPPA